MTAQLLGLLGHALIKVHLLTVTRRLMEHNAESDTDGMIASLQSIFSRIPNLDIDYVRISVDLAHEYVKLGRLGKASLLYSQTLSTAKNSRVSEQTRVFFFLRFAESSAIVGNVLQRYSVQLFSSQNQFQIIPYSATMYCEAQALSELIPSDDKRMPTVLRVHSRIGFLERAAMAANAFAMIQYHNVCLSFSISIVSETPFTG
jgi:separase